MVENPGKLHKISKIIGHSISRSFFLKGVVDKKVTPCFKNGLEFENVPRNHYGIVPRNHYGQSNSVDHTLDKKISPIKFFRHH